MNQVVPGIDPLPHDAAGLGDMHFIDSGSLHWRLSIRTPAWRPPTDLFETEDAIIVRMEVAGMTEDGFTIELDGKSLMIRGTRQDMAERRAYHQMEIHFGEFVCELELPVVVDAGRVEAVYQNGFLRISLPKTLPRQIPIDEFEA
jgi:HSP20 family protein